MPDAKSRAAIVLVIGLLIAGGCGSSSPSASPSPVATPSVPAATSTGSATTPAPTNTAPPSPTATATAMPTATATPTATPAPTASAVPADPFLGQVVVTVSDRLRVRSQPRVSDDSIRYEPLLPLGTELFVLDGPASGSGYTWYKVRPVSFIGLDPPGEGWVAMAGKDGEPWIALAEDPIAGVEVVRSSVTREPGDPADARTAAESINAFGLDLLAEMLANGTLKPDENAVFSPASIALALAMARLGARGDTAAQMDAVLHASGADELSRGLNALDRALASRNATWEDENLVPSTRELVLRIANAAFGQRDWTIEPGYLDAIATAFGAGLRLVDFVADTEAARRSINQWVSDRTAQRIPELLGPADVTPQTRLVLVNAIYLKAAWLAEFDPDQTETAGFTRLDGSRVDVPMMQGYGGGGAGSWPIPYARGSGWQAVELRYLGPPGAPALAMALVLPDDLAAFESRLSADRYGQIIAALDAERRDFEEGVACPNSLDSGCYPYDLELFMPRFSAETKADLIPTLTALGIVDAFDPGLADLSGISPERPLYIGLVTHQANIDVDEKGTEAAAATAVGVDTGGGPSALEEFTVRFDRPFLFLLRDVETGAILFLGRVVDP